jgi:archaellum biogenesis ATPase FlaH
MIVIMDQTPNQNGDVYRYDSNTIERYVEKRCAQDEPVLVWDSLAHLESTDEPIDPEPVLRKTKEFQANLKRMILGELQPDEFTQTVNGVIGKSVTLSYITSRMNYRFYPWSYRDQFTEHPKVRIVFDRFDQETETTNEPSPT